MTELTGRHIEFELFTLSFDEYLGMKGFLGKPVGERRAEFEEYLRYGGFPRALTYDDPEAKATYIGGSSRRLSRRTSRRARRCATSAPSTGS